MFSNYKMLVWIPSIQVRWKVGKVVGEEDAIGSGNLHPSKFASPQ
tara:strand:- start:58 stop:192 length:135 start_codon:yes stop_codon:yes gene_type:complete